jgi:hypothetical protein
MRQNHKEVTLEKVREACKHSSEPWGNCCNAAVRTDTEKKGSKERGNGDNDGLLFEQGHAAPDKGHGHVEQCEIEAALEHIRMGKHTAQQQAHPKP